MTHLSYSGLGQPCRNFNILATAVAIDPLDNREKLVLSNYAMGETGSLILIDPLTGRAESIDLPVGAGAWGLANLGDGKLVVGTCVGQAYLHVLDLRTRRWDETLTAEGEAYFWQLTVGSDGNVYGGTYPGCALIRYEPSSHTLTNLGRLSAHPANQYSRPVWGEAPGLILANFGFDLTGMAAFDLTDLTIRPFGAPGEQIRWATDRLVCTEKDGILAYYDAETLLPFAGDIAAERIPRTSVVLSNGQRVPVRALSGNRLAGVRGQDYFVIPEPEGPADSDKPVEAELKRIPVPAPATAIFTLQSDGRGRLWGASGFGQTVFSYASADGAVWNSSAVCDAGGEVYGMQFADSRLFLTAYVGGDHIVYDPDAAWDQLNNVNPRTLRSVAPALIRPEARSAIGPDGGIWTGWSARYGTYGGGLSRIDTATLDVECWYDPVAGQQVAGIAADAKYVYFTTNGGASGLPRRTVRCSFGVWEPGRGLLREESFEQGREAGNAVVALGGRVLLAVGSDILIYDPERFAFVHSVPIGLECSWLVALDDRTAGAFGDGQYWEIDAATGSRRFVAEVPGYVRAAAMHEGKLYFAVDSTLYVFNR